MTANRHFPCTKIAGSTIKFIVMKTLSCYSGSRDCVGKQLIGDVRIHLQQGLRPESSVSATNEYSTFEEACVYFIRTCGILEPEKYFAYFQPEIDRQLGLFEDKDD